MDTLVLIEWIDAHQSTDSWTCIDDVGNDGDRIILTVGFLLPVENGGKHGHVTTAQSIDEEEKMVDNVLHIPTQMIRRMSVVSADSFSGANVSSQL